MTVTFESDREAFLAVLALVVGADSVGSLQERDFLFQRVQGLELFAATAQGEFAKLLGSVTDKVYEGLPRENGAITAAGAEQLLSDVAQRLGSALRKQLAQVASELCLADGGSVAEGELLARIKLKLG